MNSDATHIDLPLLTFTAGMLDALSCLRVHAFTANMTGNTVLLGLAMLGLDRARAGASATAIAAFLAGAAIAALVLTRRAPPGDARSDLGIGVALEFIPLTAF